MNPNDEAAPLPAESGDGLYEAAFVKRIAEIEDVVVQPLKQIETEEEDEGSEADEESNEDRLSQKWKKPVQMTMLWVERLIEQGAAPIEILRSMLPPGYNVKDDLPQQVVFQLIVELAGERRFRNRLPQFNDFSHAVELFKNSKKILIITGAGVSVSCGIPDFRSVRGIYATLKIEFPDLPHPTAMFDIGYFKRRPQPFFSFAKEIFPGQYKPSISHMFIKYLEDNDKLLRNYTQNIDTLERVAGITRFVECHGSFGSATCLQCRATYTSDDIREDIYAQRVARCPKCTDGIIKPDIVFFGEDLSDHFHLQMTEDKDQIDLVVVIGSSMQVQPVSLIPFNVDDNIPQILINRENLKSYDADIKLIGHCDDIITALSLAMGGPIRDSMLKELSERPNFAETLEKLTPLLEASEDRCIMPKMVPSAELIPMFMEMAQENSPAPPSSESGSEESKEEDNGKVPNLKEEKETQNSKEEDDEDEVPAKRRREEMDEPKEAADSQPGPSKTANEELSDMYENRFVHVPAKLPTYSYAKFEPNLNIFPGADFYFDRDLRSFGALPRVRDQSEGPSSNSSECGDSSDLSADTSPNSCPELGTQPDRDDSTQRAESCPAVMATDGENQIKAIFDSAE